MFTYLYRFFSQSMVLGQVLKIFSGTKKHLARSKVDCEKYRVKPKTKRTMTMKNKN